MATNSARWRRTRVVQEIRGSSTWPRKKCAKPSVLFLYTVNNIDIHSTAYVKILIKHLNELSIRAI